MTSFSCHEILWLFKFSSQMPYACSATSRLGLQKLFVEYCKILKYSILFYKLRRVLLAGNLCDESKSPSSKKRQARCWNKELWRWDSGVYLDTMSPPKPADRKLGVTEWDFIPSPAPPHQLREGKKRSLIPFSLTPLSFLLNGGEEARFAVPGDVFC